MNRTFALRVSTFVSPLLVTAGAYAFQESTAPDTWSQDELEALSKRIEDDVAAMRGEEYLRPVAVKIATREDFLAYAQRRMELTTPPEQVAADEAIAKLLGVIPPDMDLLAETLAMYEDQVGGYYDPIDDSFSLMQGVPKGIAGMVLAHELTHALDDQIYALDGPMLALAGRTDGLLAYQSVVEGSGMALMTQWQLAHMDELDLAGNADFLNASARSMASVPTWIWRPALAVYVRGASFLLRSDSVLALQTKVAVPADIEQSFRTPPRSTEQVLHPEKYWDPARIDEPREVAIETGDLPKGWSVVREDTLGELMLAIVCTYPEARGSLDASNPMAVLGVNFTNDAATGWDGDRVVLLANGSARYLVLVTQWDGERDAAEFYGALALLEPTFEAAARALGSSSAAESGADVAYGASADEVVLRVHSGVERRDLRKLEKAFARSDR